MMKTLTTLLADLVSFQSITPFDAGCQNYMISYLEKLGFQCQSYDNAPVSNFYAQRGTGSPLLMFAGHTDVVPVGDESMWQTDPFILEEKDGVLYGRGTADMKGSLAAMLIAASRFINDYPQFTGSLGFLITSGEEGDEFHLGTPYVMQQLHQQGVHPNFCIVGEPSSTHHVGDTIKIGRRGSLTGTFELQGKQGHVAYPHLAENPIHRVGAMLAELTTLVWDEGNAHFPPTSLQVTHIHAGGQASNIIPGTLHLQFNLRYSTEHTATSLKEAVEGCFARHDLKTDIVWRVNGEPFLTHAGQLLNSCKEVIPTYTHQPVELSTSGGTSDGRFIAPYGVEVIELGPVNATIHQVNECVSLNDLELLSTLYYALCEKLLVS
jgi:succinyl-diaminopimelate desuccinylase